MAVKFKDNRAKVIAAMKKEEVLTLERIGLAMKNELHLTLSGNRHGKVYKVPGAKIATYQASAPGEAPAVATGKLRKSIAYKVDKVQKFVVIGTPQDYGLFLETGTRKMLPRPWLRVTFNRNIEKIRQILGRFAPK